MAYYRREIDEKAVLCDRCGFGTHHRPSREGDISAMLVEAVPGWSWDPRGEGMPEGDWCWAPVWSSGFHACDRCGRNANDPVPLYMIDRELLRLEGACTCGPEGYTGYDKCRQLGCDDACPVCSFPEEEA